MHSLWNMAMTGLSIKLKVYLKRKPSASSLLLVQQQQTFEFTSHRLLSYYYLHQRSFLSQFQVQSTFVTNYMNIQEL